MKTRNYSKNIFSLIFLLLLSMSSLSNYSTKKITLAKNIYNILIQKQMIDNDNEHFCKCEDEDLMRSKVKIDDFKLKDKNLFGANKHLKKEVIDATDYGHPGIYKNFQILKNEFREIYTPILQELAQIPDWGNFIYYDNQNFNFVIKNDFKAKKFFLDNLNLQIYREISGVSHGKINLLKAYLYD